MNLASAMKVLERISRLSDKARDINGSGSSWSHTFSDGNKTTYILNDVKSREELEDEISNVFIWFWNFKDYLKSVIERQGGDARQIEELVNSDLRLAICADIANRLKHGSLKKSRSGKYPTLGNIGYTFTRNSMSKITFRGPEIEFDFKNHDEMEIKMPIYDSSGSEIGQALDYLAYAIGVWENEVAAIKTV